MRQSDLLDRIKTKHPNLTEEQIKLILKSFHDGLRHYLTNPLETKGGILVNGLMCAYIKPKKVKDYLRKIELNKLKRNNRRDEGSVEFYNQLLVNIEKYERQGRKKSDDE